ncbi:MAG TPA: CehA/McbA family metallohydrolase [Conexibacter sp.]
MIDLTCVIHVHSLHSDGTGTVAEIATAAAAAGVDVVLLTDHDTLAARYQGQERWHGSVLVCVGEEVTKRPSHHYLAFGIDAPIDHRGRSPEEVVAAVADAGGIGFTAHPFSVGSTLLPKIPATGWLDPAPPRATGMELWSMVTDASERLHSWRDVAKFLLAPGASPQMDHPRPEALRAWDRAGASHRVVAVAGLDAHQFGLRLPGGHVLNAMSYRRSFELLRTHVLLERPTNGDAVADREAVYNALREGRCYIARDELAPAGGFRFWAEGSHHVEMGEEAPTTGGFTLHVRLPRSADVRIVRDGVEHAHAARATSLTAAAREPGVYRVEVSLRDHGRQRTWILSNPIYLRGD